MEFTHEYAAFGFLHHATYNRRSFVPLAIEYFLCQDYPEKGLVIHDDGEDNVADLVPCDPCIRYFYEKIRRNVGAKRNALCELAQGEIISHWDDDDWYSSDRLSRHVFALSSEAAEITGSSRLFFMETEGQGFGNIAMKVLISRG